MATISFYQLSDETIAKYERLEREGKLTPRQRRLWQGHKLSARVMPMILDNEREKIRKGKE